MDFFFYLFKRCILLGTRKILDMDSRRMRNHSLALWAGVNEQAVQVVCADALLRSPLIRIHRQERIGTHLASR